MKSSRIKDSYTISEVSRLFGIGIDSLRYYERLGIVTPARAANGYRIYSLSDMYKLACIKELRGLGLGMDTIGTYLEHQTLANTNTLIEDELALIDAQMNDLEAKREALEARQRRLEAARTAPVDKVFVETIPARRCVKLSGRLERDEEMDLASVIEELERAVELPFFGPFDDPTPIVEAFWHGWSELARAVACLCPLPRATLERYELSVCDHLDAAMRGEG